MSIELYWQDVYVYIVEFNVAYKDGKIKKLCKTLVFKELVNESMIEHIIFTKFSSVLSILHIELIDEMALAEK